MVRLLRLPQLILVFAGLLLLAVLAFFLLHRQHPKANNSLLPVAAFGLLDMLSDTLFMMSLWDNPGFETQALLALVFLAVPAGLNLLLVSGVMVREYRSNPVSSRFGVCVSVCECVCVPVDVCVRVCMFSTTFR